MFRLPGRLEGGGEGRVYGVCVCEYVCVCMVGGGGGLEINEAELSIRSSSLSSV